MTSINVAIKADLETFIKIREEHCGNVEHTTKRPKVRSGNQKILVIRPIRLRDLHFMTQFKGTTKERRHLSDKSFYGLCHDFFSSPQNDVLNIVIEL